MAAPFKCGLAGIVVLCCTAARLAAEPWPASDWLRLDRNDKLVAAGDVDGDGFADVVRVRGNGEVQLSRSVEGFKAAPWKPIGGINHGLAGKAERATLVEGELILHIGTVSHRFAIAADSVEAIESSTEAALPEAALPEAALPEAVPLTPPPYEPEAELLGSFTSASTERGVERAWAIYDVTRPHRHRVLRTAVIAGPEGDRDDDGLSDDEEASLGTDPRHRDTDDDGLLDGWEVNGLPVNRNLEGKVTGLDPLRPDVIVAVSRFQEVKLDELEKNLAAAAELYRSVGIELHCIVLDDPITGDDRQKHWRDNGDARLPKTWRGIARWMQVSNGGGGQSGQLADMGSAGRGAPVFAHELGHQLGLSHTGDCKPDHNPLYTSLMNYAFNYSFDGQGNRVHFSEGALRDVELRENSLLERVPFSIDDVGYLAKGPYYFKLEADGDETLVDWNHNGVFETEPVVADINYGYSTHAGERRTHHLVGAGPAMAYVGDTCLLATVDHKQTKTIVRAYFGDEKWSDPVDVPESSTHFQPVLVGGGGKAYLFIRGGTFWRVCTITLDGEKPAVSKPATLLDLPLADLSAIAGAGGAKLITRFDTGELSFRKLEDNGGKFKLTEAVPLDLKSSVPPALVDAGDDYITIVGSGDRGDDRFAMYTAEFYADINPGDTMDLTAENWIGRRAVHATTRPVAIYRGEGDAQQLCIFHTGWPNGRGLWTGYRTIEIGNKSFDGGWLTRRMYDEWTVSRVPLAFADGPQGAMYAFRWDAGDHRDWPTNTMFVGHAGWGIDPEPMRDFDDGKLMREFGIRHSILVMRHVD